MSSQTSPDVDFSKLLTPTVKSRSLDDVVTQLRALLMSGDVGPGQRLPSERALASMLTVSRTTVREALRVLEAQGFVDIRLGGTGGAFFRGPDPATVGTALSTLLLFESATEQDLNEFRFDFEQRNAELAATRAAPEEIDRLVELRGRAQALGDHVEWTTIEQLDLEVHELLPVMTHNSVRIAISLGIHDALARVFAAVEPQADSPRRLRADVLGILDLLIDRDASGARQAMADHLASWRS